MSGRRSLSLACGGRGSATWLAAPALVLASLWGGASEAKPIAFANGTTVMLEYGGGTMQEVQAFHAPRFDRSFGGGVLHLESANDDRERRIAYLRGNVLVKRWNLEAAQANVFAWGGFGAARLGERPGTVLAGNAGGQVDYETRRIYLSAKVDLHRAEAFSHRIDTVQLGFAPYAHDYDELATWFLVQARRYGGGLYDGTEGALLLRFFKRNKWLEAGVTEDGALQAMFMVNF
jgi:hypothetical protein